MAEPEVVLRPLAPSDSVEQITALLHRAYARNASEGLRYLATHQEVEVTRERLSAGFSLMAEAAGEIVGTITLRCPQHVPYGEYEPAWTIASFGQFAIDPRFSGQGLGARMLELVEAEARRLGAVELCLDTAQPAHGLIRYYEALGFRIVARADWRPDTNYESWIMAKSLL